MAGRGSRFSSAGYEHPKPLIDVNGDGETPLSSANEALVDDVKE